MSPGFPINQRRLAHRAKAAWCGAVVTLALVAGCTPEPPEKERPPEPQAAQHSPAVDVLQAPLERARAVQTDTDAAAAAQREAIDAATGG